MTRPGEVRKCLACGAVQKEVELNCFCEFCSLACVAWKLRHMVTVWHSEPSSCFLSPRKKVSLPGSFQGAAVEPTSVTEPRLMLLTSPLPTV